MYTVAMVFLFLEPVGIPVMFGFVLYKNREALSAGDSAEETAISFDAFKKMVKIIKPDSAFSEEALESVYRAIDKDASGAITLTCTGTSAQISQRERRQGTSYQCQTRAR